MAKKAQLDAVRPALNALDAEVTAAEKVLDAVEAGADKVTDVLESGLEKVADVVPETLDKGVIVTAEATRRGVQIFRDPRKVAIILGISCAAIGAGVGVIAYRIARKRLEKEFEARLDTEIDSMRAFYKQRYKAEQYATPQSAAEALGAQTEDPEEAAEAIKAADALENYQGKGVVAPVKPEGGPTDYDKVKVQTDTVLKGIEIVQDGLSAEPQVREKNITVERNVFVEGRPLVLEDWDAEVEEASRRPEVPYVISHDEFMENSFEHEQESLTYYEGDDVLAEMDDSVIYEVESIVGTDNLSRFGHGSRDPNIVYIRNERTERDYEVARHKGKYAEEVHGLSHSDQRPHRRSRWGDDE